MITENDFKYLKEAISADMAEFLAKDFGMDIPRALDVLYNSDTFAKLSDPHTGLYFQSSLYVYSFLKAECTIGRMA